MIPVASATGIMAKCLRAQRATHQLAPQIPPARRAKDPCRWRQPPESWQNVSEPRGRHFNWPCKIPPARRAKDSCRWRQPPESWQNVSEPRGRHFNWPCKIPSARRAKDPCRWRQPPESWQNVSEPRGRHIRQQKGEVITMASHQQLLYHLSLIHI